MTDDSAQSALAIAKAAAEVTEAEVARRGEWAGLATEIDDVVCTGPGRCTAGYYCPVHGPTSHRWEDRDRRGRATCCCDPNECKAVLTGQPKDCPNAETGHIVLHARGDLKSTDTGAHSLCNEYATGHHLTAASDNRVGVSCAACLAILEGATMPADPDLNRGLYGKFRVERLASSSRGKDHSDCRYFVLDPQHDVAALAALARYAQVVRSEGFGPLADDLDAWVIDVSNHPAQQARP